MKDKYFTGVLYRHIDKTIIIIENPNFRFQEHFDGFTIDVKNSMFSKLFGYKKFSSIFKALFEFQGTIRSFEMMNDTLYVDGLSIHCDGKIHATGYQEEIWKKKGN